MTRQRAAMINAIRHEIDSATERHFVDDVLRDVDKYRFIGRNDKAVGMASGLSALLEMAGNTEGARLCDDLTKLLSNRKKGN
jgi:hypothetical protein